MSATRVDLSFVDGARGDDDLRANTILVDQGGPGGDPLAPTMTPVPPTAAQITHFAAAPDPTGRIRVTWETASEVDVVGFRVQRVPEGGGSWAGVGALVTARGTAAGGTRYTLTDLPGVGSFRYRLEIVHTSSPPEVHGPVAAVVRALKAFLPVAMRH